jgi:hypothetical protein
MCPIALLLDQYPAHMIPMSGAKARELGIRLILVPKRGIAVTSLSIAGSTEPLNQRLVPKLTA